MYQEIYRAGQKLGKRERFGLHHEIEQINLKMLATAIEASLQSMGTKLPTIRQLRRQIEINKQLIRTEEELGIIETETYWRWQERLQQISKNATGWEKFIENKKTQPN